MFPLMCKNPNTTWVEIPICFELPLSGIAAEFPPKRDDGLF